MGSNKCGKKRKVRPDPTRPDLCYRYYAIQRPELAALAKEMLLPPHATLHRSSFGTGTDNASPF